MVEWRVPDCVARAPVADSVRNASSATNAACPVTDSAMTRSASKNAMRAVGNVTPWGSWADAETARAVTRTVAV